MLSEIIQELEQCDSEIERLLQQPRVPRSSFEQVFARQRTALQRLRSLQQAQAELQQVQAELQRSIVLQTTDLSPFVLLKLEVAPASGERSGGDGKAIDLLLTIQFNLLADEPYGRPIKVGIRHGWLKLKLKNGSIPLDQRGLIPPLSLSVKKTEASEQTFTGNIGLSLGVERGTGTTITTEYEIPQVFIYGNDQEPVWEFQSPNGYCLFGACRKERLGTIQVDEPAGEPCQVEAVFAIDSSEDLFIYREGALPEANFLRRISSEDATYREIVYRGLTS